MNVSEQKANLIHFYKIFLSKYGAVSCVLGYKVSKSAYMILNFVLTKFYDYFQRSSELYA